MQRRRLFNLKFVTLSGVHFWSFTSAPVLRWCQVSFWETQAPIPFLRVADKSWTSWKCPFCSSTVVGHVAPTQHSWSAGSKCLSSHRQTLDARLSGRRASDWCISSFTRGLFQVAKLAFVYDRTVPLLVELVRIDPPTRRQQSVCVMTLEHIQGTPRCADQRDRWTSWKCPFCSSTVVGHVAPTQHSWSAGSKCLSSHPQTLDARLSGRRASDWCISSFTRGLFQVAKLAFVYDRTVPLLVELVRIDPPTRRQQIGLRHDS